MARPKTEAAEYHKIMLRVPPQVLEECKRRTKKSKRSLNAELISTLEHGLLFEETIRLRSLGDNTVAPENA